MRLNAAIVVLLTSLVAATYGFGIYLFAQLVPDMQATLGFDFSYVGSITASAQLGFLLCALLAVWLTPKIGGGWMIVASGAVCALALLLIPLSNNILVIGALLTLLAGTAATVFVPMVDVIARVTAYRYRGLAMGLVSSGTSYGVAINSLLVPLYAAPGEWRSVWGWVGLITVAMALLVLLVFKKGSLLSTTSPPVVAPMALGLTEPGKRSALIQPWVLLIWSMNFLIGFATFPFQTYLSSYLRTELGFNVQYSAQVWAVIGFVGMFAGLAVGWLSDRTGLRAAMLLVYACVVTAALIFVIAPSGYWPLVAAALFSTAFYPIFGLIPAYVSKLASSSAMAVSIFGVANVMQGSGGMLGNYGAGLLANVSGSFAGVYASIAGVGAVLIILTLKLPTEARAPAPAALVVPPPAANKSLADHRLSLAFSAHGSHGPVCSEAAGDCTQRTGRHCSHLACSGVSSSVINVRQNRRPQPHTPCAYPAMPLITTHIHDCAARLRAGHLVAMPTETVYGLAADARQDEAIQQVFTLKGRPSSNPLIVHLQRAEQVVEWAAEVPAAAQRLMQACWPGPLTLVLPARDEVSRSVTAGQDSVALRVPAHPDAQALLAAFGGGLVAPSANRYMSISPTSAAHVAQQFADSDLWILDGGACPVGLESSIVSLLPGDSPRLLRRGMLSQHQLEAVLGEPLEGKDGGVRAAGQHHRHYAPSTLSLTFERAPAEALTSPGCGWLWCGQTQPSQGPAVNLGNEPQAYAAGLYAALYQLDALGLERLYIQLPPHQDAWAAVHDRLARASQRL